MKAKERKNRKLINQFTFEENGSITEKNKENPEAPEPSKKGLLRRGSSRGLVNVIRSINHDADVTRPKFSDSNTDNKIHQLMSTYQGYKAEDLMKSIVNHLEFTLAKTRFSLDQKSCYNATALSVRDRLIEIWNDTQFQITKNNHKRVYYLSIEYLLGRSLQNALLNMEMEGEMKKALMNLGMKSEEIYDNEIDAGLGNGGLGRLAACFLDSFATLNYPAWGYGIRYTFGIFRQKIFNGKQVEIPDYWLSHGNPWEIERFDVKYNVKFYGNVRKIYENGEERSVWENYDTVVAMAYDNPIPGYETFNTINLRLWRSLPCEELNFSAFDKGNYYNSVERKQKAEIITSVLYPNDSTYEGKELRLKQQYFFVSATIQDILRRFKKKNKDWKDLPEKAAIQLNDTHPSLAIIELLRILIDDEKLPMFKAWNIVINVFSYTNHTVLPEALEKWGTDMLGKLLPRHLELIYLVNYFWMEKVKSIFPNDVGKMKELSIIEEGDYKKIRMANLSIIGSHKVNGVAKVHSQILKDKLFKTFYEIDNDKFVNVTNGVTVRRWVNGANPDLAALYTDNLGSSEWLVDYEALEDLESKAEDSSFQSKWKAIKNKNKKKVVEWVKKTYGLDISHNALFDTMVKRIHEYKRQFMYCLYILDRYITLKNTSKCDKSKFTERVFFLGGKAAPAYHVAKDIIRFAHSIMKLVNSDKETVKYHSFFFIPNYSVSKAEMIIPASDLSEHISTAGTEASGTSNMKFVMNGALIMGTYDGANIEIAEEIGEENMFIFGKRLNEIEAARERVS